MQRQVLKINTNSRTHFVAISSEVQKTVQEMNIQDAVVTMYVPHTTAGIFINEGYDPDVMSDVEMMLDKVIPWNAGYRHMEGNAAAHIKAITTGNSQQVLVENGKLLLGRWEEIFFAEFDGPRTRSLWISTG